MRLPLATLLVAFVTHSAVADTRPALRGLPTLVMTYFTEDGNYDRDFVVKWDKLGNKLIITTGSKGERGEPDHEPGATSYFDLDSGRIETWFDGFKSDALTDEQKQQIKDQITREHEDIGREAAESRLEIAVAKDEAVASDQDQGAFGYYPELPIGDFEFTSKGEAPGTSIMTEVVWLTIDGSVQQKFEVAPVEYVAGGQELADAVGRLREEFGEEVMDRLPLVLHPLAGGKITLRTRNFTGYKLPEYTLLGAYELENGIGDGDGLSESQSGGDNSGLSGKDKETDEILRKVRAKIDDVLKDTRREAIARAFDAGEVPAMTVDEFLDFLDNPGG